MRLAPILLLSLAACATEAPSPEAVARADRRFADATKGRVPGEPQTCIPTQGLSGPIQIDPRTLVYQTGASRVWVNRLDPPCPGVDDFNAIPVVRIFNGTQLCAGDLFTMVDRTGGFVRSGLCRFGKFTPYVKAK
jgi:hypothetical protein